LPYIYGSCTTLHYVAIRCHTIHVGHRVTWHMHNICHIRLTSIRHPGQNPCQLRSIQEIVLAVYMQCVKWVRFILAWFLIWHRICI
jgi:hypothetical protein